MIKRDFISMDIEMQPVASDDSDDPGSSKLAGYRAFTTDPPGIFRKV